MYPQKKKKVHTNHLNENCDVNFNGFSLYTYNGFYFSENLST